MSENVDSKELAVEIVEYLTYELDKEVSTRIEILNIAHRFNEAGSTKRVLERAEKFAEFVFRRDTMDAATKAIQEVLKRHDIVVNTDVPS